MLVGTKAPPVRLPRPGQILGPQMQAVLLAVSEDVKLQPVPGTGVDCLAVGRAERAPQVRLGSSLDFNLLQLLRQRPSVQAAVLLGTVPVLLGAGPVLISIVLVVFMALAGLLIVRCSTPLSK